MGLNDFWINNNGKKEQLNNIKHGVRKDQLGEKYQPLFDVYDVNKDGTLEDEELSNVFRSLSSFAGDDKTLDRAESSHAGNVFATQKDIEDADFMGFVKSVSDASQEIKSSTTKPTPDGGKEITTVYEDGTTETISYYPNGEYKFKKTEKHTQITTQYYTIGTNVDKEYSKAQLEQKIKSDYKKYKQNMASNNNKRDSSFSQMILPYEYFKAQYMSHVNMGESNQRFDMYKVELSETAQADVEVRDFVLNHFIETHKQTKETLDTMGIFAEVGAAINTGAGELWNTSKNIYNKYFGDGTEEDYKNFYELLRQFSPSMADAKENGLKLATGNPVIIAHTLYDMVTSDGNSELGSYEKALNSESTLNNARNHPEEYFRSYETEFQFNTGHQYSIEQATRFRETTERYQQATTIKEGLELLHEAMREVEQYSVDKDIQTYQAMPGDYMNPSGHIKKATELLLQYFKGDQEKVNIILEGSLGDENAKVVQAIKDLYKNNEKLLDMVITNERIVEGYTADGIHTKTTIKSDTKTYEQLQEQYRAQYKEMYGTDFVPDELTSEVQLAQETGGMVKLGVIMVVTSLITRNPAIASMLETSGAASAGVAMTGEASAFIQNLVTKYGAEAVAQGIKLAMLGEQVALDASLTLLDQVTSEAGVRGGELGQSVAGTTGFMTFATYIGGPLAGQVSKAVAGKLGVKSVLSMGTKTTTGAIETTKMSGSKFLNIANISDKVGKAAGTGAGFVTEVGAFSLYELAMSDESIAKILEEQTGTLGKIKIMSHVLEYMLGRKVYSKVENAKIDAARKVSGVDNWEIRQDTRPTLDGKGTQSIITVEVDGIQIGKFNNETELRLAMVDRVSKAYEEMGGTGAETPAETRTEEGVETEETYLGVIDSKGIKPVEDKVRQQWQQSDIETPAVEEKVDLFHLDQEAGLKGKPLTVENEVTDLILHGKLSENLSARYKEMDKVFAEIAQKRTADLQELAQKYPNSKQKISEGIIKILAEEFGMQGMEPKVELVLSDSEIAGLMDFANGRIIINALAIDDVGQLTEIISHEFTHLMQFRDIVAQYGEQGLRDFFKNNKTLTEEQKEEFIQNALNNDFNKKMIEAYSGTKTQDGSVNDYLRRVYKEDFSTTANLGSEEYLNQVVEYEAYRLGNLQLGSKTTGLRSLKFGIVDNARSENLDAVNGPKGRTSTETEKITNDVEVSSKEISDEQFNKLKKELSEKYDISEYENLITKESILIADRLLQKSNYSSNEIKQILGVTTKDNKNAFLLLLNRKDITPRDKTRMIGIINYNLTKNNAEYIEELLKINDLKIIDIYKMCQEKDIENINAKLSFIQSLKEDSDLLRKNVTYITDVNKNNVSLAIAMANDTKLTSYHRQGILYNTYSSDVDSKIEFYNKYKGTNEIDLSKENFGYILENITEHNLKYIETLLSDKDVSIDVVIRETMFVKYLDGRKISEIYNILSSDGISKKEIFNIIHKIGEKSIIEIGTSCIDYALKLCSTYKNIEINQDHLTTLIENYETTDINQYQKLKHKMGKENFNKLPEEDIATACQLADLYGIKDINEIPQEGKKSLLRSLVSCNTGMFELSNETKKMFPLIPKNQAAYCELLPALVRSLGIETNTLSEQRVVEFNTSMKGLSESLSGMSDVDFANLHITQDFSREDFIQIVKEKVKDLSPEERQKVYDYYGFELHHNKANETGFTITGYVVNLNNGKKLAQITDPKTKTVVEDLRPDVIRFSTQNPIRCENKAVETLLNEVVEALPELRSMIGKSQHGNNGTKGSHDFDVMQHSLKVMQKITQEPKFKELNESDQKIMLLASLLHDITKSEGHIDKTHATESSFDTYFIAKKFNLSKDEEIKLYKLCKHHEWLEYVNTAKTESDQRKRLQSVAFDLQQDNLIDMAEIFTHADLKAVKTDDTFHDTTEGKSRIGVDGTPRSFGESTDVYVAQLRGMVQELQTSQPILPVTKVPTASKVETAITHINPDGSTNIKGVYKDRDGLVIIKFNEVEDWEAIGFPKGSVSRGYEGQTDNGDTYNTGNIKFIVHALDYSNQLAKFDAFSQVDSDVLLSVSYSERPESKFRFFRPQGVLLDVDTKHIYGGGNSDTGSGCGKNVQSFKDSYIFGGARESDRLYIANLIKEATGMTDSEYTQFAKDNANKSFAEIEPADVKEKIINAFASINSNIRKGNREYNEMYASNPTVMGVFAYNMTNNEITGNPVEFLNRTTLEPYEIGPHNSDELSVKERTSFLRQYALEHNLPFIVFGD